MMGIFTLRPVVERCGVPAYGLWVADFGTPIDDAEQERRYGSLLLTVLLQQ
jgi:hypothetical protein